MWQNIFLNPEWQVLRSGWRLILFIGLVAAVRIVVARVIERPILQPLIPATLSSSSREMVLGCINYGLTAAIVFGAVYVMLNVVERRPLSSLGLVWNNDFRIDLLVGLVIGMAIQALTLGVYLSLYRAKITPGVISPDGTPFWIALVAGIVFYSFVGFLEELAYRVYMMPTLAQGWNLGRINPSLALILSLLTISIAFGLSHLRNPDVTLADALLDAIIGGVLGLGFILTGRPALGIGIHITYSDFLNG